MQLLAIDLGKQKSLFCWFNPQDQTHRLQTVPTTPQAFHDLLVREPVDRVVIEVCDIAGWVADLCHTLDLPILVANAAGEGWRWRNVKNKTDRTDVLKLARLAAGNELTAVHVPTRPIRFWRSLILYRHRLIERRTRIKNAIHALLVAEGRAMPAGRNSFSPASLAKLALLAQPIEQCQMLEDLWAGHLHLELQQLDHLQQQIALLDQKLDALGSADPRVIRLQSIPGVGPRLSELVVAVLDDPHRFANVRQVSAYAGLVPRRYQSGQMDRQGRISRAGCGKLRKLLVEIAWGMLQHNARGKEVFVRISKQQRTRRKQAAVALGRRVLGWCWAMLRDGSDWREPAPREPRRRQTPASA
jgi:transposase